MQHVASIAYKWRVLSVLTSTQQVRGLTHIQRHIQRQYFIKSINSHLKNGKVCVKEITESFYRKYLPERD